MRNASASNLLTDLEPGEPGEEPVEEVKESGPKKLDWTHWTSLGWGFMSTNRFPEACLFKSTANIGVS